VYDAIIFLSSNILTSYFLRKRYAELYFGAFDSIQDVYFMLKETL